MQLRSMTAYASIEREFGPWTLTWDLRSVNHRYLDLSLRLPESLRNLESEARALVGASVRRGRLDATLNLRKAESADAALELDDHQLQALLTVAGQVRSANPEQWAPLNALEVLRWPGILKEPAENREALQQQTLEALSDALQSLLATRENEGRQLAELIETRCAQMVELVAGVRLRLPAVLDSIRAKLRARIEEVAIKTDPDRLEQEVVYLAQKMDVAEELDRLDAHIKEVRRVLRSNEPVGRRLDFLSQEMNREANTLGSKSADVETTRTSVDLKVLIEQIREQIQNIE